MVFFCSVRDRRSAYFRLNRISRIRRIARVYKAILPPKPAIQYPDKVIKPRSPLERYNDTQFRKRFRFTKEGFRYVLSLIIDKFPVPSAFGRKPLSPEVS